MREEKEMAEPSMEELKAAGHRGLPDNGHGCPEWTPEQRQIYTDITKSMKENFDEAFCVCGTEAPDGLLVSVYANLSASSMVHMLLTIAERNPDVFLQAIVRLGNMEASRDA